MAQKDQLEKQARLIEQQGRQLRKMELALKQYQQWLADRDLTIADLAAELQVQQQDQADADGEKFAPGFDDEEVFPDPEKG